MFTRIVTAVSPADLVTLYEMLSCFLSSMGYLQPAEAEATILAASGVDGGAAAAAAGLAGGFSNGGGGIGGLGRGAMRSLSDSAAKACISGLQARAAATAARQAVQEVAQRGLHV